MKIYVWDKLVRSFHWATVFLLLVAIASEDYRTIHEVAGYSMIVILIVRVIWGVIGTKYARFNNFIYRPALIIQNAKSLIYKKDEEFIGHTPLGSLMIFALMTNIIALGVTGHMMNMDMYFGEEWVEELHDFFYNTIIIFIFIHIFFVILFSIFGKNNLIKSMVSGYKKTDKKIQ